jgi:hypothetical protein
MRWRVNFHCRRWSERNAVLMERSKSKENRGDGEEGPRSQSLWHGYYPMAELQTLSAARISAGNRTQIEAFNLIGVLGRCLSCSSIAMSIVVRNDGMAQDRGDMIMRVLRNRDQLRTKIFLYGRAMVKNC